MHLCSTCFLFYKRFTFNWSSFEVGSIFPYFLVSFACVSFFSNHCSKPTAHKRPYDVPIGSGEFKYTTTMEDMWHLLECREIECFSNFKYKFSIPKRKHRLSEVGLKEDDSLYFLVLLLYLRKWHRRRMKKDDWNWW